MYAQAQGLQKTVEKQKKDAQKKFSSWFFNKFTKSGNKTQYLRDQDERAVEAERLRKQKIGNGKLDATAAAATTAAAAAPFSPQGTALQRQKSFLRAQLLEMKRQSQEALLTAKQIRAERGSGSDAGERGAKRKDGDGDTSGDEEEEEEEEDTADVKTVDAVDDLDADRTDGAAAADDAINNQQDDLRASGTRRRSSTVQSHDNQRDDGRRSRRSSVHSRMSENNLDHDGDDDVGAARGSKRNSISDELDRRLTCATMLYEEAIHALEEALQPEQQHSQPARGSSQTVNRSRRAESASKKLFARPDSEWI